MVDGNIKDFSIAWILTAVIIFGLLTFAINFSFSNNPSALGENEAQMEILKNNFSNSLQEIEGEMDTKFNSSAQLNSQETSLDQAASSSTSYGIARTGQSKVTIIKQMISWVFAGDFGILIIKIISGLFGLVLLYYVIKLIRSLF